MQKSHKHLLAVLGSALLGSAALAGGYQPTHHAPSAAPAQTSAPVQPATNKPIVIPARPITPTASVADVPAQVQTFLLTAKSGDSVTLKQTTQMNIRMVDANGTGAFAAENSGADIEEMNAMFAELDDLEMPGSETVLRIGEVFADGSRELISSTAVPMPDGSMSAINIIQRIMPGGAVLDSRVESDNPEIQAAFEKMDLDALAESGGLNSGVDNAVYGMPMQAGYSKTTTQSVDMGKLISSVLGAGMNMAAQELPEQERAEFAKTMSQMQLDTKPLVMQTVTTYKGLNRAGLPTFTSKAASGNWKMDIALPEIEGQNVNMSVELLEMSANSLSSYALNGLPMYNRTSTTMTMKLAMDTGEDTMNLTMQMSPAVTLEAVNLEQ